MLARSWPDWSGETCVIVATGPSACVPLEEAKGKARVIAIKTSWKLAPWADALYGCDKPWWMANQGVPEFRGLKFSPSPTASKLYPAVTLVKLVPKAEILTGEIGRIGCGLRSGGGHSGFQALNLAVQFGVRRIILVGFDMTLDRGEHWHPHAVGTKAKKDRKGMTECRVALDQCAPQLSRLGVEVINAAPQSALVNYPKMDFRDAIHAG